MKSMATIFCLLIFALLLTFSGQAAAIELTKDNPKTLVGTNSINFSIAGIKLGITHRQAWQLLKKSNSLMGVKDQHNPARIYVYTEKKDGNKGNCILYLIWEPKTDKLQSITVFQDFHSYLSKTFRRLLTFEAVDNNSKFRREFIGYSNRSKVTLDIPSIDLKHTTYYYDEIGLEITYKHSSDGNEIVFAIFQTKN